MKIARSVHVYALIKAITLDRRSVRLTEGLREASAGSDLAAPREEVRPPLPVG